MVVAKRKSEKEFEGCIVDKFYNQYYNATMETGVYGKEGNDDPTKDISVGLITGYLGLKSLMQNKNYKIQNCGVRI